MNIKLLLTLPLLLQWFFIHSQSRTVDIVPPSPTAAALGQFVDKPVSYYTGTPDISLPIWTVKNRDLQLPISLSYNAGGVRVDEVASWAGLSWSLNAGGVVTRTVYGLADEDPYGWLNVPPFSTEVPSQFQIDFVNEMVSYANNQVDSQPDVYYFNFAGYSGKFVLDKSGNARLIPFQKVKIDRLTAGWKITTDDGVQYEFNAAEETVLPISDCNVARSSSHISSWYLTRVVSPVNTDNKIELTYIDQTITQAMRGGETKYQLSPMGGTSATPIPDVPQCNYNMLIHGKRLSSISFGAGTVSFIPDQQQRSDLIGDYGLHKIIVKDANDVSIKEFELDHEIVDGRFMLKKVTEQNGSLKGGPYVFDYYGGLPPQY